MDEKPPKLWSLTRFLPYSWKVGMLKALAWPEHRVYRVLIEGGCVVEEHPL